MIPFQGPIFLSCLTFLSFSVALALVMGEGSGCKDRIVSAFCLIGLHYLKGHAELILLERTLVQYLLEPRIP